MSGEFILLTLRMILALGVVLALAVLLIRFGLPRLTGVGRGDDMPLEILGVRLLDRNYKLALIRTEGQRILVAFGTGGITTLSVSPDEALESEVVE